MTTDVSPVARALLAMELVQNRPGITADALAAHLGVSSRAARRHIAILREAGIPISSTPGPAGGYRPGRGLRPAPLLLTPDETLGLVMAVLDGHHDAQDGDAPVGSALDKLLRGLPEGVAAQAEAVRATASAAPDRAAARPDPRITVTLVQACADRRVVRLGYRSEAGERTGTTRDLEVDPWSVVVRHGRWYLLGWSRRAEEARTYRVDRVVAVAVLDDEAVAPPPGLDPVALLESRLATGWEYAAQVLVEAPLPDAARWLPRSLGTLEPEAGAGGDEVCRLVGSTSNPWWYAEQLARVPLPLRVLGGPELRHCVRTVGERLLRAAGGEEPADRSSDGSSEGSTAGSSAGSTAGSTAGSSDRPSPVVTGA